MTHRPFITYRYYVKGWVKPDAGAGSIFEADSQSDVWIEDCSIAAVIIQLTATSMDLGSCWAQIRDRQHDYKITAEAYIQKMLGLPECIKVECILGIGHPAEEKQPVPTDKLQLGRIKLNRWV